MEPRTFKQQAWKYALNRIKQANDGYHFQPIYMILSPLDIIVDGSHLDQDDADEIVQEAKEGMSWHWCTAVGFSEHKEILL